MFDVAVFRSTSERAVAREVEYGPKKFRRDTGVSRETSDRLETFVALLRRWNPRINLIAKSTLPDLWRRHLLDSAQLAPLLPARAQSLIDIGSGAGFPGLVLSIMGVVPDVHLVEADSRKAVFLHEAARVTGASATVHAHRLEQLRLGKFDVIAARAFAPLDVLLDAAARLTAVHTIFLLHKGKNLADELTAARKRWKMHERIVPSRSDRNASILILAEVIPVHATG